MKHSINIVRTTFIRLYLQAPIMQGTKQSHSEGGLSAIGGGGADEEGSPPAPQGGGSFYSIVAYGLYIFYL